MWKERYGKKVKCTLVQALRLCTGCMAHRGSRGIALLFHDHSTRKEWGVSVTPRPLFTPGKGPVPIVQEAGWAPGPVWTGAENLAPTGIRPQTVQPVASRYTDWATRPTVEGMPVTKDMQVFLPHLKNGPRTASDLYSGSVHFNSSPGHWLSWMTFEVFLSDARQTSRQYLD